MKVQEDEADLDLTLPLEKNAVSANPLKDDYDDDNDFEKTLIPQLDGECDNSVDVSLSCLLIIIFSSYVLIHS